MFKALVHKEYIEGMEVSLLQSSEILVAVHHMSSPPPPLAPAGTLAALVYSLTSDTEESLICFTASIKLP